MSGAAPVQVTRSVLPGLVAPSFVGAAHRGNGLLLKHETPRSASTAFNRISSSSRDRLTS